MGRHRPPAELPFSRLAASLTKFRTGTAGVVATATPIVTWIVTAMAMASQIAGIGVRTTPGATKNCLNVR
jgi:hypothetical protein